MTRLPDQKTYLVCRQQAGGDYRWTADTSDYPSSDRWLSYGPPVTLHGQGTRNSNLRSGDWIAVPQEPVSRCIEEQTVVVGAGVVSSPEAEAGQVGEPLSFEVSPNLFSITMTGYCLWRNVNS